MDVASALDLTIKRSTLDAVDLWTRVGVVSVAVLAAGAVALLVRAEPYLRRRRRVAIFAVATSGIAAWAALAFWWGGGWLVSPDGYDLNGGDWLFRVLALAGATVVAIAMALVGFVFLAVDEPTAPPAQPTGEAAPPEPGP